MNWFPMVMVVGGLILAGWSWMLAKDAAHRLKEAERAIEVAEQMRRSQPAGTYGEIQGSE